MRAGPMTREMCTNANQRFAVTPSLCVYGVHRFLDRKDGTGAL
jgi:hypothetical protein